MFAVLQTSLDQPVTREVLESAIMATRDLTRPDVPRLQKEMFGFVAGKLSREDALALHAALRMHGVETEVVEESTLPRLPFPYRLHKFSISPDGLTTIDYTGKGTLYPMSAFVFAAGGYLKYLDNRPHQKLDLVETGWRYKHVDLKMVTKEELEEVQEFRIELYFTQDPFRFQSLVGDNALARGDGQILKLRDRTQLNDLLLEFANTFPADQTNLGIQKIATGQEFTYPSVHAFEQEIIWSLHRLAHKPD